MVQNQQNEHLVGALVVNGSYSTVTLNNGFYRLDLQKGKNTIKVQYLGYQTLVFELVSDEKNTDELKIESKVGSGTTLSFKTYF